MASIQSFSAVYSKPPKILILGSIPGEASLEARQYYAHPRNAFWPIMHSHFGIGSELGYSEQLTALNHQGVALWDVLQRCERSGSLDGNIVTASIEANSIDALLAAEPTIQAVLLNGGKAYSEFKKHFASYLTNPKYSIQQMPSTSPAYAAMPFNKKQEIWRQALTDLGC